ncbi:TetR/AcrR family transcriptional regulator [Tannockella kyphosi]|uniref:TetR/AcrR family transcriptional regulator n=1 Tax=Tannockella kyphosi TaxID=2899121 RepID=UPI002013BB11|nr:TetR/AcrR family transcriptional regulator [Tannockella kyphosi]
MTDKRISKTKKNIENTFFLLLEENGIEHITIKMICASAQISRSTFYDHYEDYPTFVRSIEEQLVDKLLKCVELYEYNSNTEDMSNKLFSVIKDNHYLFSFIFNDTIHSNARDMFRERLKPSAIEGWSKNSNLPKEELELIYDFFMDGAHSLMKQWFNNKTTISEDRFLELYKNLLRYGVYKYVYI